MAFRFRLSSAAFTELKQVGAPIALIEYLAQPAFPGAARLLSAGMIARLPIALRAVASQQLGLYVTADGQGLVTHIGRIKHRLACAAQESEFGQPVLAASGKAAAGVWPAPLSA
ncbi:hypothetical protein [Chitinibacter tainanensis]|uniref:hypothetical protein n=1 Tax=Chitinibacter tainanensis TaxID=230667 RepID=UPI00040A68BB|nr:hypothetical protein [Chitinibacter tainanensis]